MQPTSSNLRKRQRDAPESLSEQGSLAAMLRELASDDAALRAQAAAILQQTKEHHAPWLINALAETAACTSDLQVGEAAQQELCDLLDAKSLGKADYLQFVSDLLEFLFAAGDPKVRRTLATYVRIFEKRMRRSGYSVACNDLWDKLLAPLGDPSAKREARLGAAAVLQAFTGSEDALLIVDEQVATALAAASGDTDLEVAAAASCAAIHLAPFIQSAKRCFPTTVSLMQRLAAAKDSERLTNVAAEVVEALPAAPNDFKHFAEKIDSLVAVAQSEGLTARARPAIVELITRLYDTFPQTRRRRKASSELVDVLLRSVIETVYEPSWGQTLPSFTSADDIDGVDDGGIAPQLIVLAKVFGPAAIASLANRAIDANGGSADWRRRNAAIMLLTHVLEGCVGKCAPDIGTVLDLIVPATEDVNECVRGSALACLASCGAALSPDFQQTSHPRVIPCLIDRLEDPAPRNRVSAVTAINKWFDAINTCERQDFKEQLRASLDQYLDRLVNALLRVLVDSPQSCLKIASCNALGNLFEFVVARSARFVPILMPPFQSLLTGPLPADISEKQATCVRSAALHAVTLLAGAAGLEHFRPYAPAVCEFLSAQGDCSVTDPRYEYILTGWNHMFICLRAECKHIAAVIPQLIVNSVAPFTPTGALAREDPATIKEFEAVRKALALGVLKTACSMCRDADGMAQYLEELTSTGLQCLPFQADARVRVSAAALLPEVLPLWELHSADRLPQVARRIFPLVMKALEQETESCCKQHQWTLLARVLHSAPTGTIGGADAVASINRNAANTLTEFCTSEEGDADSNRSEELEGELMEAWSDACAAAIQAVPGFASRFAERLLSPTLSLIETDHPNCFALFEPLKALLESRIPEVGPNLAAITQVLQPRLRSLVAAHCLGVALELYREEYSQQLGRVAKEALPVLCQILDTTDEACEPGAGFATQTLLTIMKHYPTATDDAEAMRNRITASLRRLDSVVRAPLVRRALEIGGLVSDEEVRALLQQP